MAFFALLFLIAPGFLSWSIYEGIRNLSGERTGGGLVAVFGSIMFGVWIGALNCMVLRWFYPVRSLGSLIQYLNRMDFILYFVGLSIISMLITALTWNILISDIIVRLADWYNRGRKRATVQGRNVWNTIFEDANRPHAVLIEKRGKVVGKGLLKYLYGNSQNLKEIYLETIGSGDDSTKASEFRGIYINFDNDLVIREYELPGRTEQKTGDRPEKAQNKTVESGN